MKEQLLTLEELQGLDQQIDLLRDAESSLKSQIAEMEATLCGRRQEVADYQEKISALELVKAELERNHATELDNIKRSEANMKEIKTNKEYQAVGKEISTARKLAAELEEQILQKISEIELLGSDAAKASETLKELEANIAQRTDETNAELAKLVEDTTNDLKRRDNLTKNLPSSIVRRYSMLREQRRGIAIVEARDGSCLGCNLHLPPQLYNSLFRCEEIQTCPHCQRILVMRQPTQQQ